MVAKRFLLLGIVVLALACTGTTLSVGAGDEKTSGLATAVIAKEKDGGADELDVEVTLPEPPPVMPGIETIDIRYVFEIANRGASPATIKRINVASAAGAYQLESWSRTYKKIIAPGEKEKLTFLARATNIDANTGTRAPMTLRAQIEFENADGVKKATFVRNVGGTLSVGVTRDQ